MKEEFVSYEQSKMLKALGFDWECERWYDPESTIKEYHGFLSRNHNVSPVALSAPTMALAAKWLREVKGRYVFPDITCTHHWYAKAIDLKTLNDDVIWDGALFNTYEAAMSHGLTAILRKLTEKQ